MKKRQLLTITTKKSFKITKGPEWAREFKKLPTALTADMLKTKEWENLTFKKQNYNA